MAIVNSSVVLPVEYARGVITGIVGRSKALELGYRLPNNSMFYQVYHTQVGLKTHKPHQMPKELKLTVNHYQSLLGKAKTLLPKQSLVLFLFQKKL